MTKESLGKRVIDCKKYADNILDSISGDGRLAIISVGENAASEAYVRGKQKDCDRVEFHCSRYHFSNGTPQSAIVDTISILNNDERVTGIIIQLPLPEGYDEEYLTSLVYPEKDVDGFVEGSHFQPCTPEGVIYIAEQEAGDLTGKNVVIIGRGKLVGRPLVQMMIDKNATVSVCHSKTPENMIKYLTEKADVIVVATGTPEKWFFNNSNAIVIDCGISRNEEGRLVGDVAYTPGRCTPVPGGVGLMTRAMLMKHVERKN